MTTMTSSIQDVIDILDEITHTVDASRPTLAWSGFHPVDDVLAELSDHRGRLDNRDLSHTMELAFMFYPASPLQDIAIDSGWEERFLFLADRFVAAMERIQ